MCNTSIKGHVEHHSDGLLVRKDSKGNKTATDADSEFGKTGFMFLTTKFDMKSSSLIKP